MKKSVKFSPYSHRAVRMVFESRTDHPREQGGTGERSMQEVLRHQDLESVLATVVPYFGSIRLGAGGLVRAYTDAVAQAMAGHDKVVRARQLRWTATKCPIRSRAG